VSWICGTADAAVQRIYHLPASGLPRPYPGRPVSRTGCRTRIPEEHGCHSGCRKCRSGGMSFQREQALPGLLPRSFSWAGQSRSVFRWRGLGISVRWGTGTGDGTADAGSESLGTGTWVTGWYTIEVIFCRRALTQSSHSRLRSPPLILENVSTIWRVLPLMVIMEIVMVGSRMAFSPLSTSFNVARLISCGGMEFFLCQ